MTRVTRLPGDHSQVGRLPPSCVPYHYPEKDSSPLTRGKLAARQRRVPQAGFIPAHAGKTSGRSTSTGTPTAHPRSRGENVVSQISLAGGSGSSPLTRGKLNHTEPPIQQIRLIPAHAGKTSGLTIPTRDLAAHPRSRGENKRSDHTDPGPSGSSPLTRGKPCR